MARSILLIDDDELLLRLLGDIFDLHQIETIKASTGAMGIRFAKQYLPDLIICDIRLHDMSGLDVLAQIQEDEAVAHIPIIILTGCSTDELIQTTSLFPSVISTIRKPFSVDYLLNIVRAFIKREQTDLAACTQAKPKPDHQTCDNQGNCG